MKKSLIIFLIVLSNLFANNVSLGTRTAADYNVNSLSYQHDFNSEYSGSIYYSYDALDKQYNYYSLGLERSLDDNSYINLSYNSDYVVDNYKTNEFGFQYGITFKDNSTEETDEVSEVLEEEAVSGSISDEDITENAEEETVESVVENEQWLVPRLNLGLTFSRTAYIATKLSDSARNFNFGGGAKFGQNVDISFSYNGYSYANERLIGAAGPRRIANNPLLQNLSTSPQSSLSGTLTIMPNDYWQIYYSANSTVDLLKNTAGSRTIGLNFILFENWNLDLSKETTSDNIYYSAVSLRYYF